MAHALLHPSFGVQRIYRVSVSGALRAAAMRELGAGVVLADGERCAPCELRLLSQAEDHSVVELVLVEGRLRLRGVGDGALLGESLYLHVFRRAGDHWQMVAGAASAVAGPVP